MPGPEPWGCWQEGRPEACVGLHHAHFPSSGLVLRDKIILSTPETPSVGPKRPEGPQPPDLVGLVSPHSPSSLRLPAALSWGSGALEWSEIWGGTATSGMSATLQAIRRRGFQKGQLR